MAFLSSIQTGLLADSIFELLGPLVLFGIYAVAAIAKKWIQSSDSGRSNRADGDLESELKKAVKKRYQQIYDRQVGKTPPPKFVKTENVQNSTKPRQYTQWDRQQQAIRQRQEWLQKQQAQKHNTAPAPPQKSQPHQHKPVQQPKPQPKPATHKPVKAKAAKPVRHSSKVAKKAKVPAPVSRVSSNPILAMLNKPENLRSAIILKEILDKPIGLREM